MCPLMAVFISQASQLKFGYVHVHVLSVGFSCAQSSVVVVRDPAKLAKKQARMSVHALFQDAKDNDDETGNEAYFAKKSSWQSAV